MIRAEQIHLKQRKGPVTDLRRKRFLAMTASLLAAVGPLKAAGVRANIATEDKGQGA